jgi:hypothetical protein
MERINSNIRGPVFMGIQTLYTCLQVWGHNERNPSGKNYRNKPVGAQGSIIAVVGLRRTTAHSRKLGQDHCSGDVWFHNCNTLEHVHLDRGTGEPF